MNISKKTGIQNGSRDRNRELVRLRDNHTCQICYKKWQIGKRRFDIHHLDEEIMGKIDTRLLDSSYDRENTDKLVTLCHKCHLRLHWGKVSLKESVVSG